ncbi:VPLPA-CTERM sorting domain-containing protein [Puniceibacterium sediminis]|uniref:VPLPA-CTERM protein sorting domain-containing protein n=1 Tax=Puniceibacterium sediminis TaxID=1608407 RepID=A0A238W7I5_9RHOB|nr:VPLPA-CTERM sorting domain-containing protein [Puniceibacterium sediminis]SNR42244.1 VPLPA-CTERM protein sorting domain-containing protein [Puniceibacterium sediminis]
MMMSMRGLAIAAVLALAPVVASAATVKTGIFAAVTPPVIFANGSELGTVSESKNDTFANQTATFVAGENLNGITISVTINPYLTVTPSSPTLSNSIALSYSLNGGATTPITITKFGAVGGATIENFIMATNDVFRFFVNGVAGKSGNTVTLNVLAPAVPLPAAGLLLLGGIAGLASARRKKRAATTA